MNWQNFVIEAIKQIKELVSTPAAFAVVTYLVGLHQKQPGYMQKKETPDERSK